jgi:acyl-homoserine lactone acylase PvdQ
MAAGHRAVRLRLAATGIAALAAISLIPGALSDAASAGSTPAGAAAQHVGPGAQRATIVRSAYGVPTITAGSTGGMWFGAGWA